MGPALLASGRLNEASDAERERRGLSLQFGSAATAIASVAAEARSRAELLDDQARARRLLDSSLAALRWDTLPSLDRAYGAVLTARIVAGDVSAIPAQLTAWERLAPPRLKAVTRREIAVVRGELALAKGQGAEALREFVVGDVGVCVACSWPRFARAYDAMGKADSVIYWYERFVQSSSINLSNVDARDLPRAYRRLGELSEAKGDTKRAIQRYSDFVAIWNNADPALQPLVKDVHERIARLQRKAG